MNQVRFMRAGRERQGKITNGSRLRGPDALVGLLSKAFGNGDKSVTSALELGDSVLKDLVSVD